MDVKLEQQKLRLNSVDELNVACCQGLVLTSLQTVDLLQKCLQHLFFALLKLQRNLSVVLIEKEFLILMLVQHCSTVKGLNYL